MVEQNLSLDTIFGSLADSTRRDMLRRLMHKELSIGEIAQPYDLTFAAVSKHLKVLEKARLVVKRRQGKEQMVSLVPEAFATANEYLQWYQRLWGKRLDSLEQYLKEGDSYDRS